MFEFLKNRKRVIRDRDSNEPYLVRWYLFLKDRKNFPFNVTLHKVLKSDEPVLHDHPWSWGAIILKGGYYEHIPIYSREGAVVGATKEWRGPGHIRFRSASNLHWLELAKDKNGKEILCWSLFFMGRQQKDWGFVRFVHATEHNWQDAGYKWISHKKYLKE